MMRTPRCAWCKRVFYRQWRSEVTEYTRDLAPQTSERWPTIHLHPRCAYEFQAVMVEEYGAKLSQPIMAELAPNWGYET